MATLIVRGLAVPFCVDKDNLSLAYCVGCLSVVITPRQTLARNVGRRKAQVEQEAASGKPNPMAQSAIPQWQNGVVAIGARRSGEAEPTLKGTGWLVDLPAGLLCTCAHVVMDCYPRATTPAFLDALTDGVAIGVGIGESIRWLYRADLRYLSLPSTDVGYPHALPAGWSPAGDDKRLDLAVLQLTNWDGSPLDPQLNAPGAADWHRPGGAWQAPGQCSPGELAIALPLGRSTPDALPDRSELVLLGYGQGKDMGVDSRRTSTTTTGHFQGYVSKADTGEWLKTGVTIYRCPPPPPRIAALAVLLNQLALLIAQ